MVTGNGKLWGRSASGHLPNDSEATSSHSAYSQVHCYSWGHTDPSGTATARPRDRDMPTSACPHLFAARSHGPWRSPVDSSVDIIGQMLWTL
jgi:hypothetical protein